jgi:TPR repeat protein
MMQAFWTGVIGAAALVMVSVATALTTEELRQMYVKRELGRIEEIAKNGDARAQAWMVLIKRQAGDCAAAKEWYRRAAEQENGSALESLAGLHFMDGEYEDGARWPPPRG